MKKKAIAFGTFDGLHIGHTAVIKNAISSEYETIVLTFDTPPRFDSADGMLIMTPKTKENELKKMGTTPVFMDFNEVKNIPPEEFLEQVNEKFGPSLFSIGDDFRFGKNAGGDKNSFKAFCDKKGILCKVLSQVKVNGLVASSSNIRAFLKGGDIALANKMLGRPFFFEGEIKKGDQRGRTIGFPTINQIYPTELVCPKFGVYVTQTEIEGKTYKSITNIGLRPTFETKTVTAETFIFDFSENVYGKMAKVSLLSFLREEKKFSSLSELKNAILSDKDNAIFQFSSDVKGDIIC